MLIEGGVTICGTKQLLADESSPGTAPHNANWSNVDLMFGVNWSTLLVVVDCSNSQIVAPTDWSQQI